jgi:hypothetical protein
LLNNIEFEDLIDDLSDTGVLPWKAFKKNMDIDKLLED